MNKEQLEQALNNLDLICKSVALKREEHLQLINDLNLLRDLVKQFSEKA